MPLHEITIKLDRARNVYHQGEHISGRLLLDNKHELRHDGVSISLEGFVDVTNSNFKSLNVMDTFNGSGTRTIPLVNFCHELLKPGRLSMGRTVVPFTMLLDGSVDAAILYETYHGVFISIQYFAKCRIKRSLFFKDLVETLEFVVEYDPAPLGAPPLTKQPVVFSLTPHSLSSARRDLIPDFKVSGQLDNLVWRLNEPITGEFVIEKCSSAIRSIELQLVRVETPAATPSPCPSSTSGDCNQEGQEFARGATEVQNIQIADGNVLRNTPVSIYMVLPKLFTCPTLTTASFSIGFEINLVIIFTDDYVVTENFPIKLIRSTLQPIY